MDTAALSRVVSLLEPGPDSPDMSAGYLDLLGDAPEGRSTFAQSLMISRWIPEVYERWWRPALGQLAKGVVGPTMAGERAIARDYLAPGAGDVVLDIACGPGNFTREFAAAVGDEGLVIGLDASTTMLRRAVRDTEGLHNVGYLRADATVLPFRDGSLDAVCCFAALHLFADPYRVLDRIAAVLRPGGRIALMVSCGRGPTVVREISSAVASATGIRMFGPDEITGALANRGFGQVRQQLHGVVQFVGGTLAR